MVISHKQGTDGDWNTWVSSVRISCTGFTAATSALLQARNIMALQITSLCKLFRHEKRCCINSCPTYLNQQRFFLSSLLVSRFMAVKINTKKPPKVADSKYSFSAAIDCEFSGHCARAAMQLRTRAKPARDNSKKPLHLP